MTRYSACMKLKKQKNINTCDKITETSLCPCDGQALSCGVTPKALNAQIFVCILNYSFSGIFR